MDEKLIFLDIDGTLTVAGSNRPPDSALDAIRRARALGHRVFLCTGRNPSMLAPLLAYGFDGAVACAGGHITCGGEVIYRQPMTERQLDMALKAFHGEGVLCTLEAEDAAFGDTGLEEFLRTAQGGGSELLRWRRILSDRLGIRPLEEYDGRPVYKVVFMCTDARHLEPARQLLAEEFNFCLQSAPSLPCVNGEIINRAFDKGQGIRRICNFLNHPVEDTVGFGDSMNDWEMMSVVGTSVCMESGCEALRERSDLICPPPEKDGLAWAFSRLELI